jgi:hypothetical protein
VGPCCHSEPPLVIPDVGAIAYGRPFAGVAATLVMLDAQAGKRYHNDPRFSDPQVLNYGYVGAGTPIGQAAQQEAGLAGDPNEAVMYAALRVGTDTALYRIDLASAGAAVRIASIGGAEGEAIRGLALRPSAQ